MPNSFTAEGWHTSYLATIQMLQARHWPIHFLLYINSSNWVYSLLCDSTCDTCGVPVYGFTDAVKLAGTTSVRTEGDTLFFESVLNNVVEVTGVHLHLQPSPGNLTGTFMQIVFWAYVFVLSPMHGFAKLITRSIVQSVHDSSLHVLWLIRSTCTEYRYHVRITVAQHVKCKIVESKVWYPFPLKAVTSRCWLPFRRGVHILDLHSG